MKLITFTLCYWNNSEDAEKLREGLEKWRENAEHYLKPIYMFIASGTWSDPLLNPIPNVPVVNAGVASCLRYDYFRRQYGICAIMAGLFHALNRNDWDLCIMLDWDALIGAVDFPKLLTEFQERPETILAPAWYDGIGGPFIVWKRDGICRLAHQRIHPNLCDMDAPERPQVWEREVLSIYSKERWWNPWPQYEMLVYHDPTTQKPVEDDWPFVDRAQPWLLESYARECTSKAVPMP